MRTRSRSAIKCVSRSSTRRGPATTTSTWQMSLTGFTRSRWTKGRRGERIECRTTSRFRVQRSNQVVGHLDDPRLSVQGDLNLNFVARSHSSSGSVLGTEGHQVAATHHGHSRTVRMRSQADHHWSPFACIQLFDHGGGDLDPGRRPSAQFDHALKLHAIKLATLFRRAGSLPALLRRSPDWSVLR